MQAFARAPNQVQNQAQDASSSTHAPSRTPAASRQPQREHSILGLQRTLGNQAVLRMLQAQSGVREANSPFAQTRRSSDNLSRTSRPVIQAKLTINTPGDAHEQQADRVADQVMRMPEPSLQRKCACGGTCADCKKRQADNERVQLQPAGEGDLGQTEAPPNVHQVLRSPGQPLDTATRAFMEPRFGHDFSQVRVHTDTAAQRSAQDINAHAYTSGANIVFGVSRFAPQTQDGRLLLAHELSHVVQQNGARHRKKLQRAPGDEAKGVTGTGSDPVEMWKDVVADRHFQQADGNVTFARMKILDAKGGVVANILTNSDRNAHAEEKAIRIARSQLGKAKYPGGSIVFVTDQTVCSDAGRCHAQISGFAHELGVEKATVTTFVRPAQGAEEKGTVTGTGLSPEQEHDLAGPKATAKKVQQVVVEGLPLTQSTETIYTRNGAPGGGGTSTPPKVDPPGAGGGGTAPDQKTTGQASQRGQGSVPPAATTETQTPGRAPSAPTPLTDAQHATISGEETLENMRRSNEKLQASAARISLYVKIFFAFQTTLMIIETAETGMNVYATGTALPDAQRDAEGIQTQSKEAIDAERYFNGPSQDDIFKLYKTADNKALAAIAMEAGAFRTAQKRDSASLSKLSADIYKAANADNDEAFKDLVKSQAQTGYETASNANNLLKGDALRKIANILRQAAENYASAARIASASARDAERIANLCNDLSVSLVNGAAVNFLSPHCQFLGPESQECKEETAKNELVKKFLATVITNEPEPLDR